MKDISISDIINLSEEEFYTIFKDRGSVVVVPPKGYRINWGHMKTHADLRKAIQFLYSSILGNELLFFSDSELENCPIKEFLDEVKT